MKIVRFDVTLVLFSPSAQLYSLNKVVLTVRSANSYHDYCSGMPNINLLGCVETSCMCQSAWHETTVLPGCATLSLVEWCVTFSDTVVFWSSRVIVSSEEMFPSRKKSFLVLDIKPHCEWVSVVVVVVAVEIHTFLTSAFYEWQRLCGTQIGMWLDVPQSQYECSCEM